MSQRTYAPNARIIDRVADLWVRLLRDPKYNNGDNGPASFMAQAIATSEPADNDVLERFRHELKIRLMSEFEYQPSYASGKPYRDWVTRLGVDYDADLVLSVAAAAAGLEMEFPWKTDMSFDDIKISVSSGYGCPIVHHYPMTNDRWLITSLSGSSSDRQALIEWAEAGSSAPFFKVECEHD